MACTLYVLVRYREKSGDPSIGSGQIKFEVLEGSAEEIETQLENLLHSVADSSSLLILPIATCSDSQ